MMIPAWEEVQRKHNEFQKRRWNACVGVRSLSEMFRELDAIDREEATSNIGN